jgi:hypothetical protein
MDISNPEHKDHWKVHDAMHTMLRAHEIVKDKKLMGAVKKHAKVHAHKMAAQASAAHELARRGLISDKQMAKMGSRT